MGRCPPGPRPRANAGHPPIVEILVVEDCPFQAGAEKLARDALTQDGYDRVDVLTRVVKTGDDPARLDTGSPPFRINGRDPFSPDTPGPACCLHPTGAGLRGLPEQAVLTAALAAPVSTTHHEGS